MIRVEAPSPCLACGSPARLRVKHIRNGYFCGEDCRADFSRRFEAAGTVRPSEIPDLDRTEDPFPWDAE